MHGGQHVDQHHRIGAGQAQEGPQGIKREQENAGLPAGQEGAPVHLVLVEQRDLALGGHRFVGVFVGRQEMGGVVVAQEKTRLERLEAEQQHQGRAEQAAGRAEGRRKGRGSASSVEGFSRCRPAARRAGAADASCAPADLRFWCSRRYSIIRWLVPSTIGSGIHLTTSPLSVSTTRPSAIARLGSGQVAAAGQLDQGSKRCWVAGLTNFMWLRP